MPTSHNCSLLSVNTMTTCIIKTAMQGSHYNCIYKVALAIMKPFIHWLQ